MYHWTTLNQQRLNANFEFLIETISYFACISIKSTIKRQSIEPIINYLDNRLIVDFTSYDKERSQEHSITLRKLEDYGIRSYKNEAIKCFQSHKGSPVLNTRLSNVIINLKLNHLIIFDTVRACAFRHTITR